MTPSRFGLDLPLHFSTPADGSPERDPRKPGLRNESPQRDHVDGSLSAAARLRRILAEEGPSPSEKIRSLLQVGKEALGVENAHLVDLDPADGTHTIVHTSGPYPPVETGISTDISGTYCRKVLAQGGPYSVRDAEAEGWAGDPAYESYGLSCYLGTKVEVEGELYGTVCFVDREPRAEAFGKPGNAFAEQVAQSIGQVLKQRRRKRQLQKEKRELERTKGLLRRVQRAAKVGGWELDARLQESFWTEEVLRMCGIEKESPELEALLDCIEPEVRSEVEAAIERCVENREPFTVEVPMEPASSGGWTSEQVEIHGVPYAPEPEADRAEKVVGAVRDVTGRKRMQQEVELARRESIHRLARAAEHRDNETGEHLRRVGLLARLLAEALGKGPEWQERILEAAPLHDVGKIGIPDEILLKEGPLTDAEYEAMKQHATIGADLLSGGGSPLLRMTEQVARHHHERWDGDGYPEGLVGEDIPLAARIVAVVDAFDAMTSERPYRDALSAEVAFEEIKEEAGAQFDPQVSKTALGIRDAMARFA